MITNNNFKRFTLVAFACVIVGCRGPLEPIPKHAPNFEIPFIPGINRISESGELYSPWGNPHPDDCPGMVITSSRNLLALFSVFDSSFVSIYIVKGIGWSERVINSNPEYYGLSHVITPQGLVYASLERNFKPGYYKASMDWTIEPVDGFYRAYIRANDVEKHSDFLVLTNLSCDNLYRLGLDGLYEYCN